MRWLMIGLLVSLGALLLAAAGVAYHIWRQRALLRSQPGAGGARTLDHPLDPGEESDLEIEP